MMFNLLKSTSQRITFVMVDSSGGEVDGLSDTFTVYLSKNAGAFAAGLGSKGEIANGWYYYDLTVGDTDTYGPLSVAVTGVGTLQQNLEYLVEDRTVGLLVFTYTVTDNVTTLPIGGVAISITTDVGGSNTIWTGVTDVFGVARDSSDQKPRLSPGTYYFWRTRVGYSFADPDTEVVS